MTPPNKLPPLPANLIGKRGWRLLLPPRRIEVIQLHSALVAMLALAACTPKPDVVVVTEQHCAEATDRAALAAFIIDCGKAANPMSDEEGEDLVAQCEYTGVRTICPSHMHRKTYVRGSYMWSVEEYTEAK